MASLHAVTRTFADSSVRLEAVRSLTSRPVRQESGRPIDVGPYPRSQMDQRDMHDYWSELDQTGPLPPPARTPRPKARYFFNKDHEQCVVPACQDDEHSVWYFRYVLTEAGETKRIWMGGGTRRKNGDRIDGGNNPHKKRRQDEIDVAGKSLWEKAGCDLLATEDSSQSGLRSVPPLVSTVLSPHSLTTTFRSIADSRSGTPATERADSRVEGTELAATAEGPAAASTEKTKEPSAAAATSDAQAGPTVTVTDGEFVSSLLRWTWNDDLSQKVAKALKQLGFQTREHLDRQLLEYNEKTLWGFLEKPVIDPPLTVAAQDAFVGLVRKAKKAKEQAGDDSGLLEHFINVVLKEGLSRKLESEESDADVCEGAPIHKYIDSLRAESVKSFTVDSVKRVGFSIRLDGALPDDEGEKNLLLQKLQAALEKLLPGARIRKLTHGSIIVTCDWWLTGGAWELPPAVHQFLSEPSNEFSGFRLLPFQHQSSSLRYEDYELQLRAVEEPLAIQLGHKKQKIGSPSAQLELGGEPSCGEPSCADGSSWAPSCSRSYTQVGARAEARQQEAAEAHELCMPSAHKQLVQLEELLSHEQRMQLEELLSHERRRGDARTTQATQRLMQMRLAQAALMPDPYCLDAPPPDMMQLCHRESVVQFINEVCEDFGLMTQTAGLAVSYFDRFLSKTGGALAKQRVQLLALTCTLIAAKFSEIKMPCLDDLCEVANGKYTKAQLKEMELETLHVLQWGLHAVTPHAALEQLAITIEHTDERSKSVLEHAEFFIDMSYYMYEILKFPPLVVASSALLCAWSHLGNLKAIESHMPQLDSLCGVSNDELLRCKMLLQHEFRRLKVSLQSPTINLQPFRPVSVEIA